MRRLLLFLFLLCPLSWSHGGIQAQQSPAPQTTSGPSLEETLNFVLAPSPAEGSAHKFIIRNHLTFIFYNYHYDTTVHHHNSLRNEDYDYNCHWNLGYGIALEDLDPTSVQVSAKDSTVVIGMTTDRKNLIGRRISTMGCDMDTNTTGSDQQVSSFELHYPDADYAQRASKALRHAIELVGGKASAF